MENKLKLQQILVSLIFCLLIPVISCADNIRKPAVAGMFYPQSKTELRRMVNGYLKNVKKTKSKGVLKALICPHAGYVYSGPIAASAYALLKDKYFKKTIIIGPSHRSYLDKPSIPDVDYYETPLGLMPLWKDKNSFMKTGNFTSQPAAHKREHCLEVQIPFLQIVMPKTQILPILMGQNRVESTARHLIRHMESNHDTFLIVSTDLSHYHAYEKANTLDKQCVETILANNINKAACQEACGLYPILVLMHLAEHFSWKAELLDLRNSGDTAGKKDRVVGYAAMAFYQDKKSNKQHAYLNNKEKTYLLTLARKAITNKSQKLRIDHTTLSGNLQQVRATFVTLTIDNNLRGCIGSLIPTDKLYQSVINNAYLSAYADYRFSPVSKKELDQIKIEISILTIPESIAYSDTKELLTKITPLKDGIILRKGQNRATYLPQVWEQIPDKEQFLSHLCQKAGLSSRAWKTDKLTVEKYNVIKFSE